MEQLEKIAKLNAQSDPFVVAIQNTSNPEPVPENLDQLEETLSINEPEVQPKTPFYINIISCWGLRTTSKPEPRKERKLQIDGSVEIAYEIDRWSRVIFPTIFVIFNVVYWTVIVLVSRV